MQTILQQTRPAAPIPAGVLDPRQRTIRDGDRSSATLQAPPSATGIADSRSNPALRQRAVNALSAEPSGNAEADLWVLLDAEERAFFADASPEALTYAPGRLSSMATAARGFLLDVRA